MITLSQIESDLTAAIKSKNQIAADTLRGLKSRIQNEQIANKVPGKELTEPELIALVRSEVKRRKDAEAAYRKGGRDDLANKELKEAEILAGFLPAQMSEQQLAGKIEETISAMSAGPADFGKVMGKLKTELGGSADGAMLAKILKEKLK